MRQNFSLLLFGCLLFAVTLRTIGEPPYGIDHRIPWTSSRITGSPEPPAPYRTLRAFPNLKFKDLLDVEFAPGVDRVFALEQGGKLFSFRLADEQNTKPDLVFDIKNVLNLDKVPDARATHDAYAVAFHPQFARNHYVYICYTLSFKKSARNHE